MSKRHSIDARADAPPGKVGKDAIYDHLELLAEMGQEFASSLDIKASLKRAIEHITEYVDAEGGALFLLEDDGKMLRCHACIGPTEITGLTLKSDRGIVGRCVMKTSARSSATPPRTPDSTVRSTPPRASRRAPYCARR